MGSSTTQMSAPIPSEAGSVDSAAAEAFAGQVLQTLNSGMLSLMLSVGHRTRLFDVMSGLDAADSRTIADAAGLQERYVREWLAAMTTGGVVELDPASRTYRLPPEHAACLTRAAAPENLASFAQFVAMLGEVEDDVVSCFSEGGGVPYSSFPEFQRLMAEESAQVVDAMLLDVILPLVPGLRDRLWSGIDVADVGCGAGHAINVLAAEYPASRFIGYDFSEEGVATARAEAEARALGNARFEVRDAATLAGPPSFDLITTFDSVHDQAHPARVLRGIYELLRPRGTYLCVDIQASSDLARNLEHPLGTFLYTVSCMHCMTVSLALDGDGLGTMWGEELALQMIREAGFGHTQVHRLPDDIQNNYYVAHKD